MSGAADERAKALRTALEGCMAAMDMMHEAAKGDADDAAAARLWNAAMDQANQTLNEDDAKWPRP